MQDSRFSTPSTSRRGCCFNDLTVFSYSQREERQFTLVSPVLSVLLFWVFLLWVSTFTHFCVSSSNTAEDAGNTANFMFILSFFFCGVLASPDQMPRFWIFLYRASPLSYYVSGCPVYRRGQCRGGVREQRVHYTYTARRTDVPRVHG